MNRDDAAQPGCRILEAMQALVKIVRGRGGAADEEGLAVYLRQNLPNFMQPQTVEWRDELPRNPNGKLDRVAIAAGWTQEHVDAQ